MIKSWAKRLFPRSANGRVRTTRAQRRAKGVNLIGYVRAESGVGQIARGFASILEAAEIPHTVIGFDLTRSRQEHPFEGTDPDPEYDTNLICINADQLPEFVERYNRPLLAGRYTIGVWAWEVDVLPEWMARSCTLVDEIWGISAYTAGCIAPHVERPVFDFPLPVVPPEPSAASRSQLNLPEGFTFLFCFDFDSVLRRKNPEGLIEAFMKAFPTPGETQLVLKGINGSHHEAELRALHRACSERSDITLLDGYLSPADQQALIGHCDVYVSLHRAEGFGLTIGEAMALGKPVVATGFSANLHLNTVDNSLLVPYELVPVGPDSAPYPSDAMWAEPDLEAAAILMRRLYSDPELRYRLGERSRHNIASFHLPSARVERLQSALQRIEYDLVRARQPDQASDLQLRLQRASAEQVQMARTICKLNQKLRDQTVTIQALTEKLQHLLTASSASSPIQDKKDARRRL